VYRARDTRLKRDVALKILPEIFAVDPERLARFKREAQVLASLNHPNIAAIYGIDQNFADHDTTPDGRFLATQADSAAADEVHVVLNWTEELRCAAPWDNERDRVLRDWESVAPRAPSLV